MDVPCLATNDQPLRESYTNSASSNRIIDPRSPSMTDVRHRRDEIIFFRKERRLLGGGPSSLLGVR